MTTTTDVPGKYHVALDGIGFMLDTADGNPGIIHQSIRTQKEQQSSSENIGESTVNAEGFWRRSRDGWHHGAGQSYGDRNESDALRFHDSEGVDVFTTRHQLTLLNSVSSALSLVGTTNNGWIVAAGSRVYVRDQDTVKFTSDPLTVPWTTTTVTGTTTGGFVVGGMATDGATVYIANGANGIYSTTTSTSTAASLVTGQADTVFYAKGRLFAVVGAAIFNPVAAGAMPTALLDLGGGWRWVGVTGGPNHIYMLANNDAHAVVYKTTIQPDGTGLDVPTQAGELPNGEIGLQVFSYLDRVFMASSRGVRMASIDGDGNLIFGSLIPITLENTFANGFCGDDRFVWYGIRRTGGRNGLGKLDLSVETLPNTPAYAADVYEDTTGVSKYVSSVVSWKGRRIFCLVNTGVYVESATPLSSGWVTSGLLALDLADRKTPVSIDVEAGGLSATETVVEALSVDRGATFTDVGTWDDGNDDEAEISGVGAARQFELKTTLTSGGSGSPVLYRHTLKVEPGVSQGNFIILRLRLFEDEIGFGGQRVSRSSVADARAQIEAWQASREVIVLQEGSSNYNVTVRDIEWQSEFAAQPASDGEFQGVMTTRLKVVSDAA